MERRDWSDIYVGGTRLEQISEFKYLECVSMDQVQMLPIVIGRWRAREKLRGQARSRVHSRFIRVKQE